MRSTRFIPLLALCALAGAVVSGAVLSSCAASTAAQDIGVHADFAGLDESAGDLGPADDMPAHEMTSMCDAGVVPDGGAPGRLFVAATTTSGAPYVAQRAAGTWAPLPITGGGYVALVAGEAADRPAVVARQNDDGLSAAIYDPCAALIPTPTLLFKLALTSEPPALIGGDTLDVVFRGSLMGDQRLYATHYDGSWQAAVTLGNFLSTLPPVALRIGPSVHAIFTGTDGSVYDGVVNTSGGAASQIAGATSDRGPAAVLASDGTTYVVWKASDTNLAWSARPAGFAFSTPKGLCDNQASCLIASDELPVVSLDRSGAPVAAWIGKGDGIVYTSRLDIGTGIWSAALAASAEATTLPPALAPGLYDAELEVIYVRASDGQGRHARKVGAAFTATDLPSGAIGSRPTVVRIGQ